jgi:hypothetical protein
LQAEIAARHASKTSPSPPPLSRRERGAIFCGGVKPQTVLFTAHNLPPVEDGRIHIPVGLGLSI